MGCLNLYLHNLVLKSILQTIPKKERKLDYLLIWVWAVIALMSIYTVKPKII